MGVLVIAEHDNRVLRSATLNTIAAATRLGGEVQVLVAGHACADVVAQAKTLVGVSRVLVCEAAHYDDQGAENLALLAAGVAQGHSHVLVPATPWGRNLAPRLAALLDAGQVSDIVAVKAVDTYVRPIYAGNVLATVRCLDPVTVVTVRSTAFDAVATGNDAPVDTVSAAADLGLSRLLGRDIAVSSRPELVTAKVVVSGGRGLGNGENYRVLLEPLADKLGAALGASRAAVDAGFVANDYQVGQTGKIVAPELYLAIGISGAIQHLAGMKESKVIVAINKDADAPIFQVADYGLVGDLFEAVPELVRQL